MNKYLEKIAEWVKDPISGAIQPKWKVEDFRDHYTSMHPNKVKPGELDPIKIDQNHPDIKKHVDYIKKVNAQYKAKKQAVDAKRKA